MSAVTDLRPALIRSLIAGMSGEVSRLVKEAGLGANLQRPLSEVLVRASSELSALIEGSPQQLTDVGSLVALFARSGPSPSTAATHFGARWLDLAALLATFLSEPLPAASPLQLPPPTDSRAAALVLELHRLVRSHGRAIPGMKIRDFAWQADTRCFRLYFERGYGLRYTVSVDLAPFPDEPGFLRCTCSLPGCGHGAAACELLVEWAQRPLTPDHERIFAAVFTPRWRHSLGELARVVESGEARRPKSESRVIWRLHRGLEGLELAAWSQKKVRGAWSDGKRLHRASKEAELEPLEALLLQRGPGGGVDVCTAVELFSSLKRELYLEERAAPAELRHAEGGLAVIEPKKGGYQLVAAVDGEPRDRAALVTVAAGESFLEIEWEANLITLVHVSPQVATAARHVVAHPQTLPDDARDELTQLAERLDAQLPMALPSSLAGEQIPPSDAMVLRVLPAAAGLKAEILVRPLPEGRAFPAGAGPRRVSGVAGGKRRHVIRELAAELPRCTRRLVALGVKETAVSGARLTLADDEEALELLLALKDSPDVTVEWPADVTPKKVRGVAGEDGLRVKLTERRDWLGVEGAITVEGEEVALAAILEAIREGRRFVQLKDGDFVRLADALRERLQGAADVLFEGKKGLEASRAATSAVEELIAAAAEAKVPASFKEWKTRLAKARDSEPELPKTLRAELRPYQLEGFRWAARLADWGAGACLADDMGLGKTVQALALLLRRASLGPQLVVAPTSVVPNWIAEAARFAPSLKVLPLRELSEKQLAKLKKGDLLLASYGLVPRNLPALQKITFATLVIDEAQAVKNPETERTRSIAALSAQWTLALTGTPIENHLGELWSLFSLLTPGLFGSREQFRGRFALPIERDKNVERRQALARTVRPFILRRLKTEVAKELPARIEVLRKVQPSDAERQLYDAHRLAAVKQLTGSRAAPEQQRFQLLAAITRLRQLACHPKLVDPESTIPSAKLESLLELVEELREGEHRALIFSQFTSHLALVREALDAKEVGYLYLDGGTSESQRAERVRRFQAGEGELFLISLKAGGTGLNLTGADYVIHLDPWWNPAVEDQATDRAHRIGQTKPVTVYRLVASGTIEEAILALHDQKRDLATSVLEGSDGAGRLGTKELLALIEQDGS